MDGIYLLNANASTITDNYINVVATYGLYSTAGKNYSIQINIFIVTGSPIRLGANVLSPVIVGNNFEGSSITDWHITDATGEFIRNNKGYKFQSLFPLYNQSTAPNIPSNTEAWWNDPDGPWFYQVCDYEGTQYYTNMSTTY